MKSAAAVLVLMVIGGAFATYHHTEIEARVTATKQGWDFAHLNPRCDAVRWNDRHCNGCCNTSKTGYRLN